MKSASFHKVAEVLNGEINSEKLTVKGTVPCLGRFENFGKIQNWVPVTIDELLKDTTNCKVRSICHDACRGLLDRVGEEFGIS